MSGSRSSRSANRGKTSTRGRLLFLCPKGSLDSGGVISNYQLIQYLIEKGFEVEVITSWRGDYNVTLDQRGIRNRSIPYNWWTPRDTPEAVASRVIPAIIEIAREIKEFKPDVVVTNTSHIPWGAMAASMTNTPHIWIAREYPINNFEYLADKVEFIHGYSNKIMANSEELAKFYRDTYGYEAGFFRSYVDISSVQLAAAGAPVKLVSPNYISKTKNQIELINAAAILKRRRKDLEFQLLLMGEKDAAYWPTLRDHIESIGMSEHITIHDRVDEPWSMVSRDDILIQTSLSESIGRTTTEAMKLGVPVIASDIPGHREAFRLGGGVLYELGNAEDLAQKIEHALDNPQVRRRDAVKARTKALKSMSSEASNEPFVVALQKVMGVGNPLGFNEQLLPTLDYFVADVEHQLQKLHQDIARKNAETDMLMTEIEAIRDSMSYRLGRAQTNALKRASHTLKRVRRRL